jgi:hypothetical protein
MVVRVRAELLGPESPYAKARIELRRQWEPIVEAAKGIKVIDADSCEKATQHGRLLQAMGREVETFYAPVKREIDGLKKPILEHEKADFSVIDEMKRRLGAEITEWNVKQDRLRQEAERAAREAAEAAAREDLLARAVELESQGDKVAAAAMLDEPVMAPVIIQQTSQFKARGQVSKTLYRAEVTNLMELVKAVAAGRVPIHAIQADQSWLNDEAEHTKEAFNIPGCRLNKTTGTHFRS